MQTPAVVRTDFEFRTALGLSQCLADSRFDANGLSLELTHAVVFKNKLQRPADS